MTRRTSLPAGPHGGDAERVAASLGLDPDTVIDLSASLNPFAPDVAAIVADLVRITPHAISRYPDPSAATQLLADAFGEDPECVVLTNGAAEAIAVVAAEHPVGDVVEPEFSLYRRHLASVERGAPRWRSNPSNPLGELASSEATAHVWDESFHALATGRWSRRDTKSWRIISLTKVWACPGLRLGCVVAPDREQAHAIRRRRPRWSVNGLALAAVPRLLAATDLADWRNRIAEARTEFVGELHSLGFAVRATEANWVLIEADGLRARLAPQGVVVRDCASFGLPGLHRVAVPRPRDVDRVLRSFEATPR